MRMYGVKLKNHIADAMLTNLAEYYNTDRLNVVEILVRLMHRVQFGTRMYPELDLNYEGYNDTLLALLTEEVAHGGQAIAKIKERIEEIKTQPVITKAIKSVNNEAINVDEDLAVKHIEVLNNDGWRAGLRKAKKNET